MNSIIGTLAELLKMLADSFRLPALFPSLFFIILNQCFIIPQLIFIPFVHELTIQGTKEQTFIIGMAAILLGYTINAIEVPLIRLYEGYPWKKSCWGKYLIKQQLKRREKIINEKHELDDCVQTMTEQEYERGKKEIQAELDDCTQKLNNDFPPNEARILPTSLGNVIAAFEAYPGQKYGMDGVTYWSKIAPILIKEEYMFYISEHRGTLDFLLNTSFLMGVFGIECILLRILILPNIQWILPIGAFVSAGIFYKAAISSAYNWGGVFRAAFDLFRYQLADALGLKPVRSFKQEKKKWAKLSKLWRHSIPYNFQGFDHDVGHWPVRIQNSGDKKCS